MIDSMVGGAMLRADEYVAVRPDHGRLLRRAAELARELLGVDAAYVTDTRDGRRHVVAAVGDPDAFGVGEGEVAPLAGRLSELVLGGEPEGTIAEPRLAYVGLAITLSDGRVYGTVCGLSRTGRPRPRARERDVALLRVLVRLLAAQIEEDERRAVADRLAAEAASVAGLLAALEARDGYTQAHSAAVVEFALAVGRRLGLGGAALEDLRHVALLHDIGKIGVADAILRKDGVLTAAEWAGMRCHPEIGERIVASMPPLAHLAPVVRAEHERWDGQGYPDGLAGEEIPLAARITLVCDAFHAMTSDRPYRMALPPSYAITELEVGAGSQFCPRSAAAAIAILRAA